MNFDAEKYWSTRKAKKWVVNLHASRGQPETKYVCAQTKEKALATAISNSLLKGNVRGRARLATPTDLGCA